MPDFVAALLSTIAFCVALVALNALTRCLAQWHLAPHALSENGLLQFGGALAVARIAYRRAPGRRMPT
jgi:hypothetical protein